GRLAAAVLVAEGRAGELTLTFVDPDEIAALNEEHMSKPGPTDVLSFPLDADLDPADVPDEFGPLLLGDVVVCPAVAAQAAPTHAGNLDDELALLVVHGVLHVLGHDHAEPEETTRMRAAELAHLAEHHWGGPAPAAPRAPRAAPAPGQRPPPPPARPPAPPTAPRRPPAAAPPPPRSPPSLLDY
ncbi:MAG: rRNA maturation RNase YbeY, partial [Microthrixaceae bacterium]|nr:rRNA maturation RNase YbeY [Microthrixaceae bacterium]